MVYGLDERWGGGVWLLGSGKIQFVAATDVQTVEREGRGGGMALKLSKAQKRHARRGRLKILAKTIEER